MHEIDASQRVIAEQLGVLKLQSRVYSAIITFKTHDPHRVYKHSIIDRISRRITRLALKLCHISFQSLIHRLDLNLSKKIITLHLKHLGIQKRIPCTKTISLSSTHGC